MAPKDLAWHEEDIAGELQELAEAEGLIDRWSEYSDVVHTVIRTRRDGFMVDFPLTRLQCLYGSVYMFPKYTLRFFFFRRAGKKAGGKTILREIRNPKKIHKLHHIARKNGLDPDEFTAICTKQLRYWPLLK